MSKKKVVLQELISLSQIPKKGLIISQPASEALSGYLSKNTKRAYERDLKDFFEVEDLSTLPMSRVEGVAPRDVVKFRDGLLIQGMKPSTVQRKLSAIRGLYNYLMASGVIALNPAHPKLVRAPKKSSVRKTDIITWDDAVRILKAVDQSTLLGRRNYLLLLLGLNIGTRRFELLGIQIEDLKTGPEGPYVHIRGKGEKERFVALRQDVQETMKEYLKDRGPAPGPLFPGRRAELSGMQFWRIVKKYAEMAGLHGIHPHSLRAAFITLAHQLGVPVGDIQKTVGHSRGETTLGYVRDLEMIKSSATKALKGLNAEGK
jgi:site-specific recombinase XerD